MAELVEECPLTKSHRAKGNAATAAKASRAADVRYVTAKRRLAGPAKDLDGRAWPRCTTVTTTCETSAWKPLETKTHTHTHNVSGARSVAAPVPRAAQHRHGLQRTVSHPHAARGEGKNSETRVNDHAQRMDKKRKQKSIANSRQKSIVNSRLEDMKSKNSW